MSDTISDEKGRRYDELPEEEKLMVIGMHELSKRRWQSWFVSYLERRARARIKLDDRQRQTLQAMVQMHGERPFRELLVHWLEDEDVVRMVSVGEIHSPVKLFISDCGERTRRRPRVESVDVPANYERRDRSAPRAQTTPVPAPDQPTMADDILARRGEGSRDADWYHRALEEEMGRGKKERSNGS